MEAIRPLDILNNAKGKEVSVTLKNQEVYIGKIKTFDMHLNIVLFDTIQIIDTKEKKIGAMLIRGDAIVTIKNLL